MIGAQEYAELFYFYLLIMLDSDSGHVVYLAKDDRKTSVAVVNMTAYL
jgi:hypothetical protein